MNFKNKTDQQLLALYQEVRNDRKYLLDFESDIRREMNSRHGLGETPMYPKRPPLSAEKIKKISKVTDSETFKKILEIIDQ